MPAVELDLWICFIFHHFSPTSNTTTFSQFPIGSKSNYSIQTIKMKLILASLLASAANFAPSQIVQTTTSLNAFEGELGVQPPLGFFDPLVGLLDDADQERFDRLRYVELKHGRICQLAFLAKISSPVLESTFLETLIPPEPLSTPSPTVRLGCCRSELSPRLDLSRSSSS